MTNTMPYPGQVDMSHLMVCPKCGALNMLSASYCLNCGEFLPPPVGHPMYRQNVPMPQPDTGLSFPAMLLIISVVLLVVILSVFLIAFAV